MTSSVANQDTTGRQGDGLAPVDAMLRPRLLLVEDNPLNRLMIGVVLERMDVEHVAVGCAEEAILRFAREPFDAVLLDVEMDGGVGFQAVGSLLRLSGVEAPPVIALGSAGLDDEALDAAGFSGSVEHPVDTTRLTAALIIALERDLARDEDRTRRDLRGN